MAPVMTISRAVPMPPVAVVARPRVDAEYPIDTADRATDRAADNSTNRARGGIAFRRAALHSSNNALSMYRHRRGQQSRNRGKLQNFQQLDLQITPSTTSVFLGLT
jgi:hypothetical protein